MTGDVALIQLQDFSGLHAVPLGDSSKVKTGDSVTALGNADGQSAIVPAARPDHRGQPDHHGQRPGRDGDLGDPARDAPDRRGHRLRRLGRPAGQLGRPGHRHGHRGQRRALPGQQQQQSAAGFAIPINTALSVAHEIAAGQASSTITIGYPPFIGIYVGAGTSSDPQQQAAAQQQQNNGFGGFGGGFGGNGSGNGGSQSCYTNDSNLPIPTSIAPVNSGTLVVGTICGSPAATAGLTAGSVITSVNGTTIGAPQTVHNALAKFRPGDSVSLTWVTPSGQRKTASMTLTQGPPCKRYGPARRSLAPEAASAAASGASPVPGPARPMAALLPAVRFAASLPAPSTADDPAGSPPATRRRRLRWWPP